MAAAQPLPVTAPGPFDGSCDTFARHVDALRQMMAGEACFWSAPFPPPAVLDACEAPEPIALVVPTSGSTGTPKAVAHTLTSVRASHNATAEALGGHGAWLPFLPPTHIAGVQVIARALRTEHVLAGAPRLLGPLPTLRESFAARTVLEALDAWDAPDLPLFTSFVPTQLQRLLAPDGEAIDPAVVTALQRFSAILVGGAATPATLLARGRDLGINLVTTYGSSETAGGCVYNGCPLPGVGLSLTDAGVLQIDAPCIAAGYLSPTGELDAFPPTEPAQASEPTQTTGPAQPASAPCRRFVTSDLAELHAANADTLPSASPTAPGASVSSSASVAPGGSVPTLRILGRADHVINTGGLKVNPVQVEAAILADPRIAVAIVVGVPDAQWGERVDALVVASHGAASHTTAHTVAEAITAAGLPRHCVPKITHLVSELPHLAPGKVDRAAAREIARRLSD